MARYSGLCHPGGDRSICGAQAAKQMVRSGWLVHRDDGKYEITVDGRSAAGVGDHA